jgi:hypothetical protein
MASKPSVVPRWAETVGGAPAANITAPTSGQQDTGFTVGQVPPSGYVNFLLRYIYDWILYLKDAVFVATAGSGLDGVRGTGDGAGAGGRFTGGAGAGNFGVSVQGGSAAGGSNVGIFVQGGSGTNSDGINAYAGAAGGTAVVAQAPNQLNSLAARLIGSTVVGARGALYFNSQSGIGSTGLIPGDMFWDGTNLRFCKTAGTSVIIV